MTLTGFWHGLLVGGSILVVLLVITALGLWFERKFAARMQTRVGPNRLGYAGLLQPVADVVKLLQKESILPAKADPVLFTLAPPLAVLCALGAAAVVPFAPGLVAADLDIGVLYMLAIGSVTTLSVFAAGWASNNKFALLGAMRSTAQAVSYEVPLVLTAMVPIILAGSMNVGEIVEYQARHQWFVAWPFFIGVPAFVLFFLAMLAEANRIPFDIPEAESELVGGVTTEYTGMKFALFYVAEYAHTLVASAVGAALFLGGWHGPFEAGPVWMVGKTLALFVLVYWIRWTWLRFRSDQLMRLCWTVLVPLSLALVAGAAVWKVYVS